MANGRVIKKHHIHLIWALSLFLFLCYVKGSTICTSNKDTVIKVKSHMFKRNTTDIIYLPCQYHLITTAPKSVHLAAIADLWNVPLYTFTSNTQFPPTTINACQNTTQTAPMTSIMPCHWLSSSILPKTSSSSSKYQSKYWIYITST